jgi:hypothetical protein
MYPANSTLPQNLTPRRLRQTILGLYVQDDWCWRSNLTLNLGVRYEMSTVPTEVQGKLSTLINITDPSPHWGDPFFLNPTLRNFEPRVGFAWDPFNNGRTAVRGGFGIFDVLPLPYQFYLAEIYSSPFYLEGSADHLPPGSFFAGAFPLVGTNSFRATLVEHRLPRNYVMQYSARVYPEPDRGRDLRLDVLPLEGVSTAD